MVFTDETDHEGMAEVILSADDEAKLCLVPAEVAEAATVFPAREDREAPAVPVLTAVMLRAAAVLSMRPGFVQETAAAALSSSHIMQTR